jgi:hypothetical protein
MGYDVSIELADTKWRPIYDKAAETLRIDHEIETWGDGEPSDWQIVTLWSARSSMRDLAEFIIGRSTGAHGEGRHTISPDVLAMLGRVHNELCKTDGFGDHMATLDGLGLVSEDDACGYWRDLETGVTSKTRHYVSLPIVDGIDIPKLNGTIVHDDDSGPVLHGNQRLWDAYVRYVTAETGASEAARKAQSGKGTDEDAQTAREMADDAKAAYDAIRPVQDTLSLGATKLGVSTADRTVSVETETCDPAAGARFKAAISHAIYEATGSDYDTYELYQLLAASPGNMLRAFRRLGEIGMAATEAGISELIIDESW